MSTVLDEAPTIGLLFFFGVFLWIAFQAYRPSRKHPLQTHAHIPLNEDLDHE